MATLNLCQRIWQVTDEKAQRALEAIANTYDAALRTLNKAFDFTDKVTTVRTDLTVLGNTIAQNVAATAVSTAGGFKSVVGPWQRGNAAFNTTPTALAWGADSNGTGATALVQGFYPTHSGSVIGMQMAGQASTATTVTATVYKNSAATAASIAQPLSAGTTASTVTLAKGTVTFDKGDRLDVYYSANAANTGQFVSSFTVEFAA